MSVLKIIVLIHSSFHKFAISQSSDLISDILTLSGLYIRLNDKTSRLFIFLFATKNNSLSIFCKYKSAFSSHTLEFKILVFKLCHIFVESITKKFKNIAKIKLAKIIFIFVINL
ncbi:MAG: hypothetical protein Q8S84_02510 [bacterium]|nr:hypothetical protein [bacterium]MDP3380418.1 hypothetical protein [bacterium]